MAFVLISKLYRQMYANTGHRHRQRARRAGREVGATAGGADAPAVHRRADAGPASAELRTKNEEPKPCRAVALHSAMRAFLTVASLAALSVTLTAADTNWPSFRGPSALGVADGAPTPTTWNVPGGKNVRWRVAGTGPRPLEPDRLGPSGLHGERDQRQAAIRN